MPRFTATVRFDADTLSDAKDFARKVRRAAREHDATDSEWAERNARLLRVQAPDSGPTEDLSHAEAGD